MTDAMDFDCPTVLKTPEQDATPTFAPFCMPVDKRSAALLPGELPCWLRLRQILSDYVLRSHRVYAKCNRKRMILLQVWARS